MNAYIFDVTNWLLLFLILGAVNLPLTRKLLPNLVDGGWIFSKILSILSISYLAWLLGILKLIPYSSNSLILFVISLTALNLYLHKISRKPWFNHFSLRLILFEEVLFILAFIFWSIIRSHNPDIHDLEKFMDFGFINSILRSEYFPPKDMWLAGGSINYYYFGHLLTATIIKILGTRPEIGYNLMLALLFALTLTASFSIGLNLLRGNNGRPRTMFLGGLITAIFLTLFGNLQVIFAFIKGLSNYWYPDATRFIPNTIHELPIYSFVVADLHGHLLDIPLVLFAVIFFYAKFLSSETRENSDRHKEQKKTLLANLNTVYLKYIFSGSILAVMYMTNAADALIYFGFLTFITLIKNYLSSKRLLSLITVKTIVIPLVLTLISALLFSLPFQLTFQPFTEGIKFATERSPLWMFLTIWLFSLFFALSFLAFYFKSKTEKNFSDFFVALLSLYTLVLIIIPEVIYFKDIYTGQPRANTMFKFAYQAFMLFSIVSGYTFVRIGESVFHKISLKGILWLLIGLNFIEIMAFYPYLAITSAYGKTFLGNIRGLDGAKYLSEIKPDDYRAIKWINENIEKQPVILEAVGDSYTDYARISANTGLPTVLGWPVHEWLWRKDVKITDDRRTDVESIYTSPDLSPATSLLKDYKVEYIYIGPLEREKYPNLNEPQLLSLGQTIYQNGTSKIIKVR